MTPSTLTFIKRSYLFWVGLLLLGIGAIFLAIGSSFVLEERRYQREGQTATGVVLTKAIERATRTGSSGRRTETHYTVTYRFTGADGHSYQGSGNVSVSAWERMREQEPVQVEYLASYPMINRVAGETTRAIQYVFPGIGLIAVVIGSTLLVRAIGAAQMKSRVWSQGTSADATVAAVEETNFKVNKRPMWVVRYQYRDLAGRTHQGTSEYMAAEKAHAWKTGDTIRVRFDPEKPQLSVWVHEKT
jgi:hypothetical protein